MVRVRTALLKVVVHMHTVENAPVEIILWTITQVKHGVMIQVSGLELRVNDTRRSANAVPYCCGTVIIILAILHQSQEGGKSQSQMDDPHIYYS